MHDNIAVASGTCALSDYGIGQETVDALFKSIVTWLRGENPTWNRSSYLNVFRGPNQKMVVEMLFFHYDGPPEREIGSGGEKNMCRLYLFEDHCNIAFTGDNSDAFCGLVFKYSSRWAETDRGFLEFLADTLNDHMEKTFQADPAKFNGTDENTEFLRSILSIINGVTRGQVIE